MLYHRDRNFHSVKTIKFFSKSDHVGPTRLFSLTTSQKDIKLILSHYLVSSFNHPTHQSVNPVEVIAQKFT